MSKSVKPSDISALLCPFVEFYKHILNSSYQSSVGNRCLGVLFLIFYIFSSMPKAFCKESKMLIASLINYFKQERDNHGPLVPLSAVNERVAQALSINITTVSRISRTIQSGEQVSSPKKPKVKKRPVTDILRGDEFTIRNAIYDMYRHKQHVTLTSILKNLKENNIFNGSLFSLRTILGRIGFRWRKDVPRIGLMELPNIVFKRFTFLESYVKNMKTNAFHFVYLDETWVYENGTVSRSWQDGTKNTVRSIKGEGARYVVLNAGCRNGFVHGTSKIFCSKTKDPDYHGEMNQTNFLHWFETQLLPNLPPHSLIIMDNASYHSTLQEKLPNSSWNKTQIKQWLVRHNIRFEENYFKIQLLQLVAFNKPEKTYVADTMAEGKGHKVLRLPPYHCIFNPIELIWGITKGYYNKHIGRDGYGTEKCIAMWQEALNSVTAEIWANTINHTEKIIQQWYDREVGFQRDDVPQLIINLEEDSSDEEYCFDSDSE